MGILDVVERVGGWLDNQHKSYHYGDNWKEQVDFLRRMEASKIAADNERREFARNREFRAEQAAERASGQFKAQQLAAAVEHYAGYFRAGVEPPLGFLPDEGADREAWNFAREAVAKEQREAAEEQRLEQEEAARMAERDRKAEERAAAREGRARRAEERAIAGGGKDKPGGITDTQRWTAIQRDADIVYKQTLRALAGKSGKATAEQIQSALAAKEQYVRTHAPKDAERVYGRLPTHPDYLHSALPEPEGRQRPQGNLEYLGMEPE